MITNYTKLFCPAGAINTSVISAKDVWPRWGRVYFMKIIIVCAFYLNPLNAPQLP